MNVQQARQLLQQQDRKKCGSCLEDLFSTFDVLFMHMHSACYDCLSKEKSDDELLAMSEPVFEIINQL